VLSTLNKRLLTPTDFVVEPLSGAVSLTPEGRKTFLQLYAHKKQSEFKHPVLGRKCSYQEVFELILNMLNCVEAERIVVRHRACINFLQTLVSARYDETTVNQYKR